MTTAAKVCLFMMAACLCLSNIAQSAYVDCSMECLFAAFREPTVCECKNTLKLHWGKRAPRPRTHRLPTFRYGKRAVRFSNSDLDEDRLDTLRSIQDGLRAADFSTLEYES